MARSWLITPALVLALAGTTRAEPPRAHAVRRESSITVDGRLDEPAWDKAPKFGDFVQRFPKDGAKATQDTRFAILYDDNAIYIGVWADDSDPASVRRLLTRRDVDSPADSVSIGFDSYHDRRTAYAFQLNAAGVQRDWLLFDDSNQDDTWDAVWTGTTVLTERGWTAEFRIPLSQLRYATNDVHEWGFQVVRTVARTQEQSSWSPWPRSAPQTVSKYGVVDGIDHLSPARRLELLPYVTGGVDAEPIDAGDPLNDKYALRHTVGLDLKYGLGPAFTLSATINPDFGQVEADPSQITLGPYELFFAEKRPFFLEGSDLFKLPLGNSDGTVETAFYSRRIGAAPPNEPANYDYINWPQSTAIYGAAKLTGKTPSGWSVGVLDAVTGQESAEIVDEQGRRESPVVSPLTNYAAARVKRDFRNGGTQLGVSFTAVDRDLGHDQQLVDSLHDQAYTAGFQIQHRFFDNAWELDFRSVTSYVHGSDQAIAITQLDTNHLFQRVGATDVNFDPLRTSLTGLGGTFKLGRLGDVKHWRYGVGGDFRTPGLELNDLGFQQGSDRNIPFVWSQYHDDDPGDTLLNWQINADVFSVMSLERVLDEGVESNISGTLKEMWSGYFGFNADRGLWDQVALRGGPALRGNTSYFMYGGISTDTRKPVYFSLNAFSGHNPTSEGIDSGGSLGATVQARSNVTLFLGPTYEERTDPLQYVAEVDSGAPHYLFAKIRQVTTAMTVRLDWTFSTRLSLQAYAQPFVASGRYSEYKEVDHPDAVQFSDRFHIFGGNEYAIQNETVFVHRPGESSYSFSQPDFDVRQFRSTIVLRWEYRPGSTVFAIWSHGRSSSSEVDGRFRLGHDLDGLLQADGENIVMVKANYWIGL